MNVIGITGPSGAGKSLLCHFLENNNIPCIDADGVYHSLLVPPSDCLDAIRAAFGDGVMASDGSLDRTALAAIVFSDEKKLALLNATVLDYVLVRIRELIAQYRADGYTVVAVDAPTLIESEFDRECTEVISVLAPTEIRVERIMKRDGLGESAARARIDAQKKDSFYIEHSDAVLENGKNETEFISAAENILAKFLSFRQNGEGQNGKN